MAEVAERDEAEERDTDQEREDPQEERTVSDLGAVVLNAFDLFLLHRLRDGAEELLVRLRLAEPLQEKLRPLDLSDRGEHLAQQDDLTHDIGREQHLLAARAGRGDVDRVVRDLGRVVSVYSCRRLTARAVHGVRAASFDRGDRPSGVRR